MRCIFIVLLYIITSLLFSEVKTACTIKDIKQFLELFCNTHRLTYTKNLHILTYKFIMIELKGKPMINERISNLSTGGLHYTCTINILAYLNNDKILIKTANE